MAFSGGSFRFTKLRRITTIMRVLLKHFLGDVADRLFKRKEKKARRHNEEGFFFKSGFPSPKRIRLFLEDLGPSFVKLGQLMSTPGSVPTAFMPWMTRGGMRMRNGLSSPTKYSFTTPRVDESSRGSYRTTFIIPLTTQKKSVCFLW